jgi:hypothetical protein
MFSSNLLEVPDIESYPLVENQGHYPNNSIGTLECLVTKEYAELLVERNPNIGNIVGYTFKDYSGTRDIIITGILQNNVLLSNAYIFSLANLQEALYIDKYTPVHYMSRSLRFQFTSNYEIDYNFIKNVLDFNSIHNNYPSSLSSIELSFTGNNQTNAISFKDMQYGEVFKDYLTKYIISTAIFICCFIAITSKQSVNVSKENISYYQKGMPRINIIIKTILPQIVIAIMSLILAFGLGSMKIDDILISLYEVPNDAFHLFNSMALPFIITTMEMLAASVITIFFQVRYIKKKTFILN